MERLLNQIDNGFGTLVSFLAPILFADIGGVPLIVLTLLIGAVTFTIYFGFINIRGFKHSIEIIKGKYDNPNDIENFVSSSIVIGNILGSNIANIALVMGFCAFIYKISFQYSRQNR